jgi:16S rRNA (cytosine1402-N4)-methyltransferase
VLAIDRDPSTRRYAEALTVPPGCHFRWVEANFRDLGRVIEEVGLPGVAGVLFDLGLSSMQLEPERGFSFRAEGPLDMRMSPQGMSAADIVNTYPVDALAALLYRYGEERYSRRIAKAIVAARSEAPITRTEQLVEVILRAYPRGPRRDHPARRTFQALRIAVNDELGALEAALAAAEQRLLPGGRLVVISYHSLEDRIVKHFIRDSARLEALHKRPLTASAREVSANPRARSAKLRSAEKRGEGQP